MFYEFEKKFTDKPWSMSDMHCHQHYELYILLEGTRSMFIENSLYNISPLSVVLIPPFVMHKTEGQNFIRVNINYSKDYLSENDNDVFNSYLSKKVITPPAQDIPKIKELVDKLERYSKKNTAENNVFTKCLTYELLFLLCNYTKHTDSLANNSPKVLQPTVLTKIMDYINGHLDEELSINSISENFYISRSYLCKLFRKYVGISVTQSILNLRIAKACKLLADGKKSINEISEICGFSSSNYFGLIFKKHIGLSPINYRKYQEEKQG